METKEAITSAPVPPRQDNYQHLAFNQLSDPELVGMALRVHAEGYTSMGFVSKEAVRPDGTLDESIDHSRGCFTDYYLAVNPSNPQDMATIRKISISPGSSVEELPAFSLCKDGLYPEGIDYLHTLEAQGYEIKEIAGLARTKEAQASGIYEILRSIIQDALGKDEIWFFSIVSDTFDSLTKNFGRSAFNVIGEDVKIGDERVSSDIQLRPSIFIPDQLFGSMIKDVNEAQTPRAQRKILTLFMYLTEGLDNFTLGEEVAEYRHNILSLAE